MKVNVLIGIVAIICLVGVGAVSAETIYVPDEYDKIQWAVDNATEGDNIIVRDGTYYENVNITTRLTLKSENGSANCIVNAGGSGNPITLNAGGVTIKGFTATNSGSLLMREAGIKIFSNANTVTNNTLSNNLYGIYLYYSNNNIITNNNVSNNKNGIYSLRSSNCTVTNNTMTGDGISLGGPLSQSWVTHTIEDNTVNGNPLYYFKNQVGGKVPEDAGEVILANCTDMKIENLNITNTDVGIELGFSSQNIIKNNKVSKNDEGIYLYSSSNNNVTSNYVSKNDKGIYLRYGTCNNLIINNNISNNGKGIWLASSNNNVTNNNISNNFNGIYCDSYSSNKIVSNNVLNNWNAIYLTYVGKNSIYLNNFLIGTKSLTSYETTKYWNSTEKVIYTYNGNTYRKYLGNYWSDYNGSDSDGDGIGDIPYSKDSVDYYPLIETTGNYELKKIGCTDLGSDGVDDNITIVSKTGNCPVIQWAVDNATAEDTIIVKDGTYNENVDVDKQLVLRSDNGSAKCAINGTVTLDAGGITVDNLTLTGSGLGLDVLSSNNKIINNNISSNDNNGINLYTSNNKIISTS